MELLKILAKDKKDDPEEVVQSVNKSIKKNARKLKKILHHIVSIFLNTLLLNA